MQLSHIGLKFDLNCKWGWNVKREAWTCVFVGVWDPVCVRVLTPLKCSVTGSESRRERSSLASHSRGRVRDQAELLGDGGQAEA